MLHKKLQLLLAVFIVSISSNAFAYRWIFSNFTNRTLVIQVELKGSNKPYFCLVKPDHTADFEWGFGNPMFGFCLGKVKYTDLGIYLNSFIKYHINEKGEVIDNYHAQVFLTNPKTIAKTNPLKEGKIIFQTDPLFQKTVKSGTALGGKLVAWIAKALAESNCRSRDYAIVEKDNGEIVFYTKAN